MTTPFAKARAVFNSYCAMSEGSLPEQPGPALQVVHYRWTQEKVPKHVLPPLVEGVLGMSEELGELQEALNHLQVATAKLAHLALNHAQGRRGYDADLEGFRAKVADALADHAVFAHHAATAMRLDYWTLVHETAAEVMKRNWKSNPLNAQETKP